MANEKKPVSCSSCHCPAPHRPGEAAMDVEVNPFADGPDFRTCYCDCEKEAARAKFQERAREIALTASLQVEAEEQLKVALEKMGVDISGRRARP